MEPQSIDNGSPAAAVRIRLALVDDHRMFAEALEMLLAASDEIEMAWAVGTGEEAVELYRWDRPDVMLMDIHLPGMDGIETTRRLRRIYPELKIVIVTAFPERDVIARAMEAGASAYVPKTHAADELVQVIKAAAGMTLPADRLETILAEIGRGRPTRSEVTRRLDQLTSRELQILQALAEGRTGQDIARKLFISHSTVQTHVKNVLRKLGVHSKLEAVTFALRNGLIRVSASEKVWTGDGVLPPPVQ